MSIVTAWRTTDQVDKKAIKEELLKMFAPFGGIGMFIQPDDRVLLKPDVSLPALPEDGLVTDLLLVGAMIELALSAGAASVTVAESANVGYDTMENFCVAGYDYLCEESGADLCDLNETKTVLRQVPQALLLEQLEVFQTLLLADVVINLPKLKVLPFEGFCGATTNLLGAIPPQERELLQDKNLGRGLFDLSKLVIPDLTIMEGLSVNYLGEAEPWGLLLVGADTMAVDAVAAGVMGYQFDDLEYLQLAEQYGLSSTNPGDITIFGDDLTPLIRKVRGKRNEKQSSFN
ncbi:MAG: DUF362 domain-containing protein [Bacillota bacterium]